VNHLVAVLIPAWFLCGCSSSILTDIPREYPWHPSTTSFQELQNDTRDETLTFVLLDGRRFEGVLIMANPDSIVWTDADTSIRLSFPTDRVERIQHTSHLIPVLIATPIWCFMGTLMGEFAGSESGGAHPRSAPASTVIGYAVPGAAIGFLVGYLIPPPVTRAYDITPLTFRRPTPSDSSHSATRAPGGNN
jgi:hypothetical protein